MTKLKLDKAQEKRFDEFVKENHTTTQVEPRLLPEDKAKQHLAQELSLQKKEAYTPEQIIQACFLVISKHGKLYIDEIILELKRMFRPSN